MKSTFLIYLIALCYHAVKLNNRLKLWSYFSMFLQFKCLVHCDLKKNIMLILHFIAISQTNIKNHKCKYHASDGSLPHLSRRYNPKLPRGSRGVVKQRTHSSFALQSISWFGIHLYENMCSTIVIHIHVVTVLT